MFVYVFNIMLGVRGDYLKRGEDLVVQAIWDNYIVLDSGTTIILAK